MDFGSLLHVAQENEHKAKRQSKKCYSTSFSAPKKEQKDSKSLSANIQKFLARREEEEKKKEREAKQKRDELLALRSQDGKAKKRVAAMLKRTKAANKSAIEDAIDDDNTAVTLNGPSQPDEDDYGYVSQEASAYYNKLMDKYNSTPVEEPLFSKQKKAVHKDLNSTKDRVRMALLKKEEEEMMPHKRKRRSKIKKEDDPGDTTVNYHSSDMRDLEPEGNSDAEQESERQPVQSKPKIKKLAAPPLMNFQDLLKLAEKKQFEPVKIEPKKKSEEDERPMTKKQKLEHIKEQEWRQRKEEAAKGGQVSSNPNQPPKIPKISRKDDPAQRSGVVDRGQERTSGPGLPMRIPKINSVKRDEERPYPKEEEKSYGFKREEKSANNMKRENTALPRQNGNFSRENSFTMSSKANVPAARNDENFSRENTFIVSSKTNVPIARNDDKPLKKIPKDNDIGFKKQRLESDNSIRKSQIHDEGGKLIRSDYPNSSLNSLKRLPPKPSEGKQNEYSILKNCSVSGYEKKLQEAINAKMQESQKKRKLEENITSKSSGKPSLGRDLPSKVIKDIERSIASTKTPGKLPSKLERPVEQKSNSLNLKPGNSSSKLSQESNTLNKQSIVPSIKPRVLPPEAKSKPVPSSPLPSTRPLSSGDIKTKQTLQSSGHGKPSSMSESKLMPPPQARPKTVPPGARPKQIPPSDSRTKQFPPADVKPKQFPPTDIKSKQFPPTDSKPRQIAPANMKPRQFPPPDVQRKQFPPPDVQRKQFPPPDVRRNAKPPPKRRIIDSEDEYDPEMDDFIDDGPGEEEDYSRHIREIFGYDRRKYSRIGDDDNDADECMESNFATILKEDYISTKTGILEDLEDVRREKEMERRKKIAKKKKMN